MTDTIELLNRRCKYQQFPIPTGYHQKTSGPCKRGDMYWDCGREGWMPVQDSHSFLGIDACHLQCVMEKNQPS